MKVAFASCSSIGRKLQHKQPIWGIIKQQSPDMLILLGDNVYLGSKAYDIIDLEEKMTRLAERYDVQLAEYHFSDLLSNVDFLAVWDNHDFGLPGEKHPSDVAKFGAEVDNNFRDASRNIFNDKLRDHPRSLIPARNDRIYDSYTHPYENIKFIMVDVRSNQERPINDEARLLDGNQKEWLLCELRNSTADINVICSGICYSAGSMGWAAHGKWFEEFNKVLLSTSKPLFLGGNVHNNGFYHHVLQKHPKKNFYEIFSSGVGQNFKTPIESGNEEWDPPEEIAFGDIYEQDSDKFLMGRPRNNYGIIDFTTDHVFVSLYGQRKDAMHYVVINRHTWKREEYWCMIESKPKDPPLPYVRPPIPPHPGPERPDYGPIGF